MISRTLLLAAASLALLGGCGADQPVSPTPEPPTPVPTQPQPEPQPPTPPQPKPDSQPQPKPDSQPQPPQPPPPPPPPPPATTATLVGAGDIAVCGSSGAEQTAKLLDKISGEVFAAGDNAYSAGSLTQYQQCYHPSWGRHKSRTHPVPGNHEYETAGASGYFSYFGSAAGPSNRGYYSYNVGAWHVVALNSEQSTSSGDAQLVWLAQDLKANPAKCTAAILHKPRFSSGNHGDQTHLQALWQVLYDNGVDVVVSGHDHHYERFAPMTPSGARDDARGIRSFVVGTGGAAFYGVGSPRANSEFITNKYFGVLRLDLSATSFAWQFVTAPDGKVMVSGTANCH